MQTMLSNARNALLRQRLDRNDVANIAEEITRVQAFCLRFTEQAKQQLIWQNDFIAHYQFQDTQYRQRLQHQLRPLSGQERGRD
jgi:conjugative transfer pilus assembly protein TraH